MDLKQIGTGGASDEVTKLLKALDHARSRLLGKEADAQEPCLGFVEDKAVIVLAEATVEVARLVHVPGPANVPSGGELDAASVLEPHDSTPPHGEKAHVLVEGLVGGGR